MHKIAVLVADDHAVLRWGVGTLINSQPDMEVVGEAKDSDAVLERVQSLQPDVVLLDLAMPGVGGLRVLQRLRSEAPEARVVVVSMHGDPAHVRPALAAGAMGYIVKASGVAELLTAVRSVYAGRPFVDPSTAQGIAVALVARSPGPEHAARDRLTSREQQVLAHLARGYTNREIAAWLGVSVKTVETYRARVYRKLGFRTRAELVQYALLEGLLDEEAAGDQ